MQPGNSFLTGVAYYNGNPTGATVSAFDCPPGTLVIDYSTPAIWLKVSALGNNSTYIGGGASTLTAPLITGGLTASGSASNDFSGSTGTFKTSTGLNTLGGATTVNGSLKSNTPGGGIGYAAGAGGSVTQITNANTGVTLNTITGQVTTVSLTTAAGAENHFTVTNSRIDANDTVVISVGYTGAGVILAYAQNVASGSFKVGISNLHASAALNDVAVVNFTIIKGVVT